MLLTYDEAADIKVNHEEPGGTFIEVPGAKGEVKPTSSSMSKLAEALLAQPLPLREVRAEEKPSQVM